MAKVAINTKAPDFTLEDYEGERFSLSDLNNKKHALLVFNRGFM